MDAPVTWVGEPLVLSTWRFGLKANAAAWTVLSAGNGTALDAVEAACRAVEADPEVTSVGYGGLPDASGQVSLDAAVMLSPEQSAGVAYVRSFPHPSTLARMVLERSPHKLLVGEGAERLAVAAGFDIQELRTPRGLAAWRSWIARHSSAQWTGDSACDLSEKSRAGRGQSKGSVRAPVLEEATPPPQVQSFQPEKAERNAAFSHDTIGVLVRDSRGCIVAGCSTSGLAFKWPGRVGDSPIIGHGLYVDPKIGGAVATGHGELIMGVCGSFLAVEYLRRGACPEEAVTEVLRRIVISFGDLAGKQAALIVLAADGRWAAGALRPGFQVAMCCPSFNSLLPPHVTLFSE
jgi:isoaspartyl peptidase/L-asparaginase-like protein (Ntn-hydrolase superfamily)